MWDLLLTKARIFDPSQNLDQVADIAINQGHIVEIQQNLPLMAKHIVSAQGQLVTCGHIDIHTHVESKYFHLGLQPEIAGVQRGITQLADAGSVGHLHLAEFLESISNSQTQVQVFLNINPWGVANIPEIWPSSLDWAAISTVIKQYRQKLCGLKLRAVASFARSYGLAGIKEVKALAKEHNLPLMIHLGEEPEIELPHNWEEFCLEILENLEAKDILSHVYTHKPGGCITIDQRFYPALRAAKKRGVILDAAVALTHFDFKTAKQGLQHGFIPTTISTDLTTRNQNLRVFDLATTMSRFLALGLSLEEVILAVTHNASLALGQIPPQLQLGQVADLSICRLLQQTVCFRGSSDQDVLMGQCLLLPEACVRQGVYIPALPPTKLKRDALGINH